MKDGSNERDCRVIVDGSPQTRAGVLGTDQVNGVASYEVDLWGKLRNRLRSRKTLAQASDADRAAMQLNLEAQLASSYFRLRGFVAAVNLVRALGGGWTAPAVS